MVNTTYNSIRDWLIKLQNSKGKTNRNFYQSISTYYDEMNYRTSNTSQFEEGPFADKAERRSKIYQEVLLLMKFLQTKPQVESVSTNCCDLYYTVI